MARASLQSPTTREAARLPPKSLFPPISTQNCAAAPAGTPWPHHWTPLLPGLLRSPSLRGQRPWRGVHPRRAGRWLADSFRNTL